ncbi:DUF1566 domain-containing protein [Patescibacteria group bacterium]|nr:DUF1566 domain-containing protein [Patescibacteria group bacterium]
MKKLIILSSLFLVLTILGCQKTTSNDTDSSTENENYRSEEDTDSSEISCTVVDTGQESCSNNTDKMKCPNKGKAFYGQDAQYVGNKLSYRDNGDGTVTDVNTGLMWQQDPGAKKSYEEAQAGAQSFELAGHDDWRLPTIKELYSLMDFRGIDPSSMNSAEGLRPYIDDEYFGFEYGDLSTGDRIIDSQWATSSVYNADVMNNQECFFGVNFADGRIKCYPTKRGKGYFTIYVRGDSYGENNLVKNSDTISDKSTGLTWMKQDSGSGMNWEDALAYCEDLELDGKSDWRLPNAKELHSIVDYSRSPDATNSAAIDPLFEVSSITNEAGKKDYAFFWTSTTHISERGYDRAAYIPFGRALGYMKEFGGWVDVHGAGAQRSDPKAGDPDEYPTGLGPQGDAIRIDNYVRCVRSEG